MILIVLFIIISLAYCLLMVSFYLGWKIIKPVEIIDNPDKLFISVIIAVRNESENLPALLDSLLKQDYPAEFFEVIIIDDHSIDDSYEIASEFLNSGINLKVIKLVEQSGKKQAIFEGVKHAKGELIMTTDGDSITNSQWISVYSSFYQQFNPLVIIGPVSYSYVHQFFNRFQSLEFLSLQASTAGACGINKPIMANAANMAFEKKFYLESASLMKNEIPSGDDVFLVHAANKRDKNAVLFLKSKESEIITKPQPSIVQFLNQRKRWISKIKHYNDGFTLLTSVIVFLFNLCIPISFILSAFYYHFLYLIIAFYCIKSIVDYLLLKSYVTFFNKRDLLKQFPLVQLIYPFYIIIVLINGSFSKFRWKDRMY